MKLYLIFSVTIFAFGILSCKKDNNTNNNNNITNSCSISSVTLTDGTKFIFDYTNGKITKQTYTRDSSYRLIYYTNNLVSHIYHYDKNNILTEVDTTYYNSNNNISKTINYKINLGVRTISHTNIFSYNTDNTISSIENTNTSGSSRHHDIKYNNNDIISYILDINGSSSSYTIKDTIYYTNYKNEFRNIRNTNLNITIIGGISNIYYLSEHWVDKRHTYDSNSNSTRVYRVWDYEVDSNNRVLKTFYPDETIPEEVYEYLYCE